MKTTPGQTGSALKYTVFSLLIWAPMALLWCTTDG